MYRVVTWEPQLHLSLDLRQLRSTTDLKRGTEYTELDEGHGINGKWNMGGHGRRGQ